jgi:hypothetical protein
MSSPSILLGIIGSPRKHGNSELIAKAIYRQLSGDWELRLMRLPELDIRPCRACYQCLFGEMKCTRDDDFSVALGALLDCNAYAVVAPAYLLDANSGLKRFLDRGLSFYGHVDRLWGKPAVAVAIAGIEGMEGRTKLAVEGFVKFTMGDLRGSTVLYGALPGEVLLGDRGRSEAKRLALAIEQPGSVARVAGIPICSVCGGDSFRFLPDGRVRCLLCSSSGSYEWREEKLCVTTHPGEHPLFDTRESVQRHAEWLRGMKDQFLLRRKELKSVVQEYTGLGTWVTPDRK